MFTNISLANKAELISFLVSLWQIDDMSNSREEGLLQLRVSQDPVHGAWLCVQGQNTMVLAVCAGLVGP